MGTRYGLLLTRPVKVLVGNVQDKVAILVGTCFFFPDPVG